VTRRLLNLLTALSLLLCVAICVLWVRSYWTYDLVEFDRGDYVYGHAWQVRSEYGRMSFWRAERVPGFPNKPLQWTTEPGTKHVHYFGIEFKHGGLLGDASRMRTLVALPHADIVIAAAAFAAVCFITRRNLLRRRAVGTPVFSVAENSNEATS
jgi:hypothetical protein